MFNLPLLFTLMLLPALAVVASSFIVSLFEQEQVAELEEDALFKVNSH